MNWDEYFLNICNAVASKSPCLSRNIGAIIVRDNSIVSTGYNGPARGYPHCLPVQQFIVSKIDSEHIPILKPGEIIYTKNPSEAKISYTCPRRARGYKSGEGLLECPAAHAEVNCISNAARLGTCVRGATMYMNTKEVACKDCMTAIVNSGISTLVTLELLPYHEISLDIARYGKVKLRRFEI